jgi:hypothetical protein
MAVVKKSLAKWNFSDAKIYIYLIVIVKEKI